MKEWFKSLFPWRWTIILLFIVNMSWLIVAGFEAKEMNPSDKVYFIGSQWVWHVVNVIFFLFIDYGFGLGREGNFLRIK